MEEDLIKAIENWAPKETASYRSDYYPALQTACTTAAIYEEVLNTILQCLGLWTLPVKPKDEAERAEHRYNQYWEDRKRVLKGIGRLLKELEKSKVVEEVDKVSLGEAIKYKPEPSEWPRDYMRKRKRRGRPKKRFKNFIILALYFKLIESRIRPLYRHLDDILHYFYGIDQADIRRQVMRLKKNESLVAHVKAVLANR